MLSTRMLSISAFAGAMAVGLSGWASAALSGSAQPAEGQAQYLPLEGISYEFGSKFVSGYFVERAAQCLVTLMIIEKSDPDQLLPVTAARVRLIMRPGQIAGLDSEEGRSLNVTCGDDATKLLVDFGERWRLEALQIRDLPTQAATAD